MASHKHLHELLRQDQEPFQLHNYITDRRNSHLNKPVKPVTKSTSRRTSLYKQACFSSFQDSPDFLKSPLKNKHPSCTVLHVPPKTAAGLLEAATKIHNQSSKSKSKSKNVMFAGLSFGSILRKLKDKNTSTNNKTRELSSSLVNGPAFEAKHDHFVVDNSKDKYEMGYTFSDCNYTNYSRRISSAGWSESNTPEEEDNKSMDLDTISSCTTSRSDYYNQDFVLPDQPHFCLSPLSPFRFALHRSPSVGRRTPEFLSPSTSPCRNRTQEDDDQATDNSQKIQTQEEEEKDQCSPVSVLDLPFEDDEREDGREEEEEEEDEDDYDLECSYALMQKAKFQLLEKLRRFERLAELEPIELEKRMLEGYEDEDDDYLDEDEEHEEVDEFGLNVDDLMCEIFSRSSPCHLEKVPGHMKRLVFDLIAEEKKNGMNDRNEVMVKMVCKRLDSWKEVESNTIDMMVELDLRRELNGWKSYEEEVGDRAKEIELAIFGLLIEEISEELVSH